MGVLDKILNSKKSELQELRTRSLPTPPLGAAPLDLTRGEHGPLHLICEIKHHSPSAGMLSSHLSVGERARQYERGGASMISVLCDEPFFHGSYEHLQEARQSQNLPLLCKEFIIDECQLNAARAYGASAVLLIVRCLPGDLLKTFIRGALDRQLTPLVEVFNEEESIRALAAGATLIGVNARDLDTLETNIAKATEVMARLPEGIIRCHLSGVKSPEDVAKIATGHADAALIGEVLMREDDPYRLLATFREAAETKQK